MLFTFFGRCAKPVFLELSTYVLCGSFRITVNEVHNCLLLFF